MEIKTNKIQTLRWYDILVLTVIMFGQGIYNSAVYYSMLDSVLTVEQTTTFDPLTNYMAFAQQGVWLFVAIAYLIFRNFDFSVIFRQVRFDRWTVLQSVVYFVVAALALDIYYVGTYNLGYPSLFEVLRNPDFSLFLYSLLNGFYEEFYFLGLVLLVKPEYTKWAFLFSLIVRVSFHTYQGLTMAIGIGVVLGVVFYVLYRLQKRKNLLPFFLAHAIADVIGLSVISYFL